MYVGMYVHKYTLYVCADARPTGCIGEVLDGLPVINWRHYCIVFVHLYSASLSIEKFKLHVGSQTIIIHKNFTVKNCSCIYLLQA